ncbi:MAG: TIGR03668 family PPOX class F420-dependent oxidoreductase [Pseudonocardiaceae bacterium]|nr:TIGR03668 family PPOX class F420-dependent oxidoreductase [Pseudonocardiaceae bacterium]
MHISAAKTRERLAAARVARLATADADAVPHLVPVTFAVTGDVVVIAIDQKPKSTTNLRRVRNIEANPAVCLIADGYQEDWSRLWWARADGHATIERSAEALAEPIRLLTEKYRQYDQQPPTGPVIRIRVHTWRGWAATG